MRRPIKLSSNAFATVEVKDVRDILIKLHLDWLFEISIFLLIKYETIFILQ